MSASSITQKCTAASTLFRRRSAIVRRTPRNGIRVLSDPITAAGERSRCGSGSVAGAASARVHRADMLTVMDDLHRGKNVGKAWQWVIDLSGVVFLVLSLVGYVLFFTLRFRLRVALVLTALSLGTLAVIFVVFVP